ncbi:hypothetical protein C1I97_00495 [Streptomyces sp. NTH33]|uniref:hypothetical protein n=1 Tax=Streptomyces sp. NTH33 TaxID=1735453 RepID=UPI000DA8D07E|nr:hypothetical protein [Streptomyces sp. NTH33]PZH21033.1 hypothetical protein C1I97_00495 [Streptomyces sp. NTH33]
MAQQTPQSFRRIPLNLAAGVVCLLVAVGGVGTWLYVDSVGGGSDCRDLLDDNRVRKALGAEYRQGLTCAQLGTAIKRVTTGFTAGEHSLKQAQSMQNMLAVMSDRTSEKSGEIDADLALPFSQALADYAADVDQILTSVNIDYIRRDTSSTSPWQDEDGVHMSVSVESMRQVIRAISGNPVAYATVRDSITREIADQFAETPHAAGKGGLSLLSKLSARVLGTLDAVAEKAREGGGDAKSWDRDVLAHLTKNAAIVPAYSKDPAGHLVASWKQKLRTDSSSRGALELFEAQGTEMVRTWSAGLGLGQELSDSLMNDSRNSAHYGHSSALRQLDE